MELLVSAFCQGQFAFQIILTLSMEKIKLFFLMILSLCTIKVPLKIPQMTPNDEGQRPQITPNDEGQRYFYCSFPYMTETVAEISPTLPPYGHSFMCLCLFVCNWCI